MSLKSDFSEIPCLNLSLANDPSTEPELLSQLRHALINVGFMYIENHGVSPTVTQELQQALPRLFALPVGAKDEVALSKSPHFLGYSAEGSETTAGKQDRREQFEFANELTETWREGDNLAGRLRGPNAWPSAQLGERFLVLVAKALSLGPETFLPFLSDQHRLKLVHYPAVTASETNRQGVGPHKDSSGWWTFLLQASPPHVKGLQVLNKSGDWIDVPTIPGSFVVNIGQAFEVVTNGVCKATTHRVLGGELERFSVPFFQGVRRDLTKEEAVETLKEHFERDEFVKERALEAEEVERIDSAFLKGKYETWGESQMMIDETFDLLF